MIHLTFPVIEHCDLVTIRSGLSWNWKKALKGQSWIFLFKIRIKLETIFMKGMEKWIEHLQICNTIVMICYAINDSRLKTEA